jgi:hypothetical protein
MPRIIKDTSKTRPRTIPKIIYHDGELELFLLIASF